MCGETGLQGGIVNFDEEMRTLRNIVREVRINFYRPGSAAAEGIVRRFAKGQQDPGILAEVLIPASAAEFVIASHSRQVVFLFFTGKAKAVCQLIQGIAAEHPLLGAFSGAGRRPARSAAAAEGQAAIYTVCVRVCSQNVLKKRAGAYTVLRWYI